MTIEYVQAWLIAPLGLPDVATFVIAELFAWLAEAAMLRWYGERWRLALLASLAANTTSVLVGELCRYYLGVP